MSAAWQQLEGSTVNRVYRLERLLGATDSSAVYLASLTDQSRPYAVKLVIAREDAARVLARWERAGQISHPHLIGIAGIGRTVLGGREMLFAAVERADEVLADALAERPLSAEEMRETLVPCLEALDHLHSKGLVHGHLTPSNVVAVNDVLKLTTDNVLRFGEDLRRGDDAPPEGTASPASDVWALGKLIAAALHSDDPPEPYGEVVRKCLAADPKERWTIQTIRQHLNPTMQRPARGARMVRFGVIGGLVTALVAAVLVVPRFQSGTPAVPVPPPSDEVQAPAPPVVTPQSTPPVESARDRRKREREERKQELEARRRELEARRREPVPEPEPPKPKPQPPAQTKTPEPEPPPVREAPAADVSAAEAVVAQSMPDVAPESLRTVSGKVRVSVGVVVDGSGNVTGTSLDSAGPSRYFATQAERAASRWKFAPGAEGRWTVRFEFTSSGVTASARRGR